MLSDINFEDISEYRRSMYLMLRAKCFEKFNDYENAFEFFAKSNLSVKKSEKYFRSDPEKYYQGLKDKLTKLKSSN